MQRKVINIFSFTILIFPLLLHTEELFSEGDQIGTVQRSATIQPKKILSELLGKLFFGEIITLFLINITI